MSEIDLQMRRPRMPVQSTALTAVTEALTLVRELANAPGDEMLWMGSAGWAGSALPGIVREASRERKGTDLRVLVDQTCRVAEVAPWLDMPDTAGLAVRMMRHVPHDLLVVGEEMVLIPAGSCVGEPVLAMVREPIGVRMIRSLFGAVWARALPFEESDGSGTLGCDEVKQRILELLAEGAKDAVIANRLGMSLRTCRRHVAEILSELGAVSRFQAGTLAARRGVILRSGH
jgi:DNA-binding CsgD family transcriptional regulator